MIHTLSPRHRPRSTQAGWALLTSLITLLLACSGAYAQGSDADEISGHLERAELALEQREYSLAATEFRRAAELGDDPEIAMQATRIAYTYGFNEEALRAAKRWRELNEDSEEALLYVAQLNLRLGNLRAARSEFARLIERADEAPEQRLLSLIPILSDEDPENADRLMRRLAQPYRKLAYGQYAMAVMALQAGEADDARGFAERAIEIDPEWIKPKLLYARALLLAGNDETGY